MGRLRKIDAVNVGDMVCYKSHEGIEEGGRGRVTDKWTSRGLTYLTVVSNHGKVVCLMNSDL